MLDDEERAGYFYHDMVQILGDNDVLLYPSTYRRAVKYAQRDAANEILRTDVLGRLSRWEESEQPQSLFVVSHPDALAERVASQQEMQDNTLIIRRGASHDLTELANSLEELGFRRVDYVYEPGEYALRGSLLDVFSFSSEYPYRIDFFGDDVDTIRTFEVQSQLSREQQAEVSIVPNVEVQANALVPFTDFLPERTVVVSPDISLVLSTIGRIYDEGFSSQAIAEAVGTADSAALLNPQSLLVSSEELSRALSRFQRIDIGAHPIGTPGSRITLDTSLQPLLHKNFALLRDTLLQLQRDNYRVFILADSLKQTDRLRDILRDISLEEGMEDTIELFLPVERTLHEGFIDHELRLPCSPTTRYSTVSTSTASAATAPATRRWPSRSRSSCNFSPATTWYTLTTAWAASLALCECQGPTARCRRSSRLSISATMWYS